MPSVCEMTLSRQHISGRCGNQLATKMRESGRELESGGQDEGKTYFSLYVFIMCQFFTMYSHNFKTEHFKKMYNKRCLPEQSKRN